MKLYKITISPKSAFVTSLKGDTIFGQLCWMIAYKNKNRLKELLNQNTPFMIVSDGFVSGYLPKPKMPMRFLGEKLKDKKINRKKNYLLFDDLLNGEYQKAIDLEMQNLEIVRNSLNYQTFKTDENFTPYTKKEINYPKMDIYFLTILSKNELLEIVEMLSHFGYGADTTIGKGKFEIIDIKEINITQKSDYYMALSPFSVEGISEVYYDTFIRFGKSGYDKNKNPFKKPIILADTASVVKSNKEIKYIGKVIKNISTYKDIIHQGYAITIPIKVKQ